MNDVSLQQIEELASSVSASVSELEALVYSQLGHQPSTEAALGATGNGRDRTEQSDRFNRLHDNLLSMNQRLAAAHNRLSQRLMG